MSAKSDRVPNSSKAKQSLPTHGSSGYFTPPTSPNVERKDDLSAPLSLTTPPPSRSSTLRRLVPVSQATATSLDSFVTAKLYDNSATPPSDEERSEPIRNNGLPQLPELQHPCARHDDLIPNHTLDDHYQYQNHHHHHHHHGYQYQYKDKDEDQNKDERSEDEKRQEEKHHQQQLQQPGSSLFTHQHDAFSAPLEAHDEEEEDDDGVGKNKERQEESNTQPFSPPPLSPSLRRPSLFSSASIRLRQKSMQRRGTHVDLSDLDTEEQAALEAEITARRAARRASRRKRTYADRDDDDDLDDRVTIGTRIGEGHQNYQLMYDMLTGIRIAVGRVSAKMWRELTPEDFTSAHKLVFDITGNELTPGVRYDFKFKDYASWVFRHLREKFHIDPADYMMSLTNKYILSELGSPGKSGSFFYYSRDFRFIIKTIHHSEHRFLRKVLREYYAHVCDNPNTLLSRFYGLHRIKLPHGRKTHFVVMGNVFPPNKDIHVTYDLKGSTFGRLTSEEEIARNRHAVLKDQNWINNKQKIVFGPEKRDLFLSQVYRDIELLKRLNIMDYSLLIGFHDVSRGNREGLRDDHLQMVTTHAGPTTGRRRSLAALGRRGSKADEVRTVLKHANAVQIKTSELPEVPSEERRYCIFYADEGGIRSSDSRDQDAQALYFFGIIDILTPYNIIKRTEHAWKSITQDKTTISSVEPRLYGERFLEFMKAAVKSM